MKIDKLEVGMTVFDCHSYRVGNTTRKSLGLWYVEIVSVDREKELVTARWNNNPSSVFRKRSWSKWTLKRPVLVPTITGGLRKPTKEELAAMKKPKE